MIGTSCTRGEVRIQLLQTLAPALTLLIAKILSRYPYSRGKCHRPQGRLIHGFPFWISTLWRENIRPLQAKQIFCFLFLEGIYYIILPKKGRKPSKKKDSALNCRI